jgi:hypothetical protein
MTRTAVIPVALTASIAAGLAATAYSALAVPATLFVVALLSVGPVVLKIVRRDADIFNPLVAANLAMFTMFFLRPTVDITTHSLIHLGYPLEPAFSQTVTLGLVATASLQVGSLLYARFGPSIVTHLSNESLSSNYYLFAGLFLTLVGHAAFLVFANTAGQLYGGLALFENGRTFAQQDVARNSTGYIYQAILLACPGSLLVGGHAYSRRSVLRGILAVACVALPIALEILLGNRGELLLYVACPIALTYLLARKRPGWLVLGFVGYLIVVGALGTLRATRIAGSTPNQDRVAYFVSALLTPQTQILDLFQTGDTEMFDSLDNSLTVVPSEVPYQHGGVLTDLVIRAIPRPLWPDKPLETNDRVVYQLWPKQYVTSRAAPYFSVVGPLYFDSGTPLVAVGMALIGGCLMMVWKWWLRNSAVGAVSVLFATAVPLTIILLRATFTEAASDAFFTVLPLYLVFALRRRFVTHTASTSVATQTSPASGLAA